MIDSFRFKFEDEKNRKGYSSDKEQEIDPVEIKEKNCFRENEKKKDVTTFFYPFFSEENSSCSDTMFFVIIVIYYLVNQLSYRVKIKKQEKEKNTKEIKIRSRD